MTCPRCNPRRRVTIWLDGGECLEGTVPAVGFMVAVSRDKWVIVRHDNGSSTNVRSSAIVAVKFGDDYKVPLVLDGESIAEATKRHAAAGGSAGCAEVVNAEELAVQIVNKLIEALEPDEAGQ